MHTQNESQQWKTGRDLRAHFAHFQFLVNPDHHGQTEEENGDSTTHPGSYSNS